MNLKKTKQHPENPSFVRDFSLSVSSRSYNNFAQNVRFCLEFGRQNMIVVYLKIITEINGRLYVQFAEE